jgi:peptidylprolyl isomerase
MKTLALLALTTAALPCVAQTATHPAITVHHTAAAHAAGGCVTPPPVSATIPALPASAPCPKAMVTITQTPPTRVDYISPLVSPKLREALDLKSETFSLIYDDVVSGTGEPARQGAYPAVKYTVWLADGTKIDSSAEHGGEPHRFQLGAHQVVPGWDLGLEGMRVGGKRRLYVPYQLAYGANGGRGIPPRALLVFDLELVGQSDKAPEPPPQPKPAAPANPPAGAQPARPTTVPPATTSPAGQTPPAATH